MFPIRQILKIVSVWACIDCPLATAQVTPPLGDGGSVAIRELVEDLGDEAFFCPR